MDQAAEAILIFHNKEFEYSGFIGEVGVIGLYSSVLFPAHDLGAICRAHGNTCMVLIIYATKLGSREES